MNFIKKIIYGINNIYNNSRINKKIIL